MSVLIAHSAWGADQGSCIKANLAREFSRAVFRKIDHVSDAWNQFKLGNAFKDFDYNAFERAKLDYLRTGPGASIPETIEKQLAFIEAFSSREILATDSSPTEQRAAFVAAKRLFRDKKGVYKKVSQATIEKALVLQYETVHGAPDSIRSSLTEDAEKQLRRSIIARITNSIARQGTVRAFDEIGLLKDTTLRERYRDFARKNDGVLSTLFNLALDVPLFLNGIRIPVFFPKSPLAKEMVIPSRLREKIWKEGPDAAYPEVKALFQMTLTRRGISFNSAAFDHRWNLFRAWFSLGVGSWLGAEYAGSTWAKAKALWAEYQESEDDREDAERQIAEVRARNLLEHAKQAAAEARSSGRRE